MKIQIKRAINLSKVCDNQKMSLKSMSVVTFVKKKN